jgi:hypothetical protein
MALITLCDTCHCNWLVDQLVYVTAVEKNLCPVCINQLVDLCFCRLVNQEIPLIKQDLEDWGQYES